MNINKNISVWRGNNTPPTDYHLWIKDDGSQFLNINNKWILQSNDSNKDIINVSKLFNNYNISLDQILLLLSNYDNIPIHQGIILRFKETNQWKEYILIDNDYKLKTNWKLISVSNLLDDSEKINSDYLPSYVDDVLEFDWLSQFPTKGESGKIYIEKQPNRSYRWTGNHYEMIATMSLASELQIGLMNSSDKRTLNLIHQETLFHPIININQICPNQGQGDNKDRWLITYAIEAAWNWIKANPNRNIYLSPGLSIMFRSTNVRATNGFDGPFLVFTYTSTNFSENEFKTDSNWCRTLSEADLNYELADSQYDGFLSKTDWTRFNNNVSTTNQHISNYNNPHQTNKSQIGLSNVTNDAQVKRSEMGVSNGVATLDSSGKVPSSQLPSYVDDVLEYTNKTTFPTTGETGKIYVDTSTNKIYRWSGITYVEISVSLALGETSSTAYPGDKGKAATDNINKVKSTALSHIDDTTPVTYSASKVTVNYECYEGDQYGSTGTKHGADIAAASETTAGVMTAADKSKLNAIESGAQVNSITGIKGNAEGSYRTGNVNITPTNIGLGNVDNTSDLSKPISTAAQKALDEKVDKIAGKGLSTEDFTGAYKTVLDNLPTNYAPLVDGIVPAANLPSYVDDVLEFESKTAFPATGESGKIYVSLDTNLTYRWGGTEYVEISKSLALGETSSTAYAGNKGKDTTDKLNTHLENYNNPHQVTKAQIGLGNVDNTSDLEKPISNAVQAALDRKISELYLGRYPITNSDNRIRFDLQYFESSNMLTITDPNNETLAACSLPLASTENDGLFSRDRVTKLNEIESGAQVNTVTGVKGNSETNYRIGNINITPTNIGLGNVDNTSDLNKPISTATQTELNKKVDKVEGKGLSTEDYTTADKTKLAGIASGAQVNSITGVKGGAEESYRTGNVNITAANLGLGNVNNTSDADKPISTATQTALNNKVDKVTGKGLSSEDYTSAEKTKLSGIEAGAQVNTITGIKGSSESSYRIGNISISPANIGLGNVDNTSDLSKPISTATQSALDGKVDKISGKRLSIEDYTKAEKDKLAGIEAGAQVNTVTGVKGNSETNYRTGNINITPTNIGLGNVDNTSDLDKPVSTAQQIALDKKVDKVTGYGLSKNDFTDILKNKLDDIAEGAQVNSITGVKGSSEETYRTGNVSISASNIGLGNVNNTSDADKPISTAQQTALNKKADKTYVDEQLETKADKADVDEQQISYVSSCFADCAETHEAKLKSITLAASVIPSKAIFSITLKIANNLTLLNQSPVYMHLIDILGNVIGVSQNAVKQVQNKGKYVTWFFDSVINTTGASFVIKLHTTNSASNANDSNFVGIIAHVSQDGGVEGIGVTSDDGTYHTDWTPAIGINVVNLAAIYPQIKELQKYRMAYATSELPDISTTGHKANINEIRISQTTMGISLVSSVSLMVASDNAYNGEIFLLVFDINDNPVTVSNNSVNLSQNLGEYVTWYFTPFQLTNDAIYRFVAFNDSFEKQVMRIHVASGKNEGVTCFDQNDSPHTDYCPALGVNVDVIFTGDLYNNIQDINYKTTELNNTTDRLSNEITKLNNTTDRLSTKITNVEINLTNTFIGLEEILAYGVEWDTEVADPHLTRIGNMSLHKTLPIQSQLKGCIAQKNKVIYWLNESDWRFKKDPETVSIGLTVDGGYSLVSDIFSTLRYEKQWVKIGGVACQIGSINTDTNTATLVANDQLDALGLVTGTQDVELGAVLNGYDGTVRVYCPSFYIKSIIDGTKRRVWISTAKIDNSYTHQPEILIDAYRSTILNTVPSNMGYLSTLPVNSAISVVNTHDYCRGGVGYKHEYDTYLETDPFRSGLCKPRTYDSRYYMRIFSRRADSEMLSYDQYKNIFYWLYVIEYANFNCQEAYNEAVTAEGYKQGGLGAGVTTIDSYHWQYYNDKYPLTPCGYCNELGNGTGLKTMTVVTPTTSGGDPTQTYNFSVPRWRGFDNPFGDIQTNLDGIIIQGDAKGNPKTVYITTDPNNYGDNESAKNAMKIAGYEINQYGYTKEFDLGEAAHIIPKSVGGDTTKYKCDYHYIGVRDTSLRMLIVGGNAFNSSGAGLGFFTSYYDMSNVDTNIGFRSVSTFVSFSE